MSISTISPSVTVNANTAVGGVRVQQRNQPREVTAACGPEPGVDDLALPGTIGLPAGVAPRTRRRARLASCRAAAEVRPTIGAISSNGTANMSCSTNAAINVWNRLNAATQQPVGSAW